MSVASKSGTARRHAELARQRTEPDPAGGDARIGFLSRLSFAAHLDPESYREIARDPESTWKVSVLVSLAGVAHGVAFYSSFGPSSLVTATLGALCFWLVLSSVVFALGRGLAPESASWGDVTRGIGVAAFALVFVAINATGHNETLKLGVQILVYAIATVSVVIAVREVLRVSTARAIAIGLLSIAVTIAGVALVLPVAVG